MSVQISYNKKSSSKNSVNKVLFIDEKYKISGLKKHLLAAEFKCISDLLKSKDKKEKRSSLFRTLIKSVEAGANGTQDYVVKKGSNKDKIASTHQTKYQ